MRRAAARVYAANVSHPTVGAVCRDMVKPFFADADGAVRAEAALAFDHINDLSTEAQGELLAALLEAPPCREALERVIRALERSPVPLPYLVCRFAQRCVDAFRDGAGDLSRAGALAAMELSKIVVRLYAQTTDPAVWDTCLELIDEMERCRFYGLDDELQRLDR